MIAVIHSRFPAMTGTSLNDRVMGCCRTNSELIDLQPEPLMTRLMSKNQA
jgi:hypothetical protein